MKYITKSILIALMLLHGAMLLHGQEVTVTGKVVTFGDIPLKNAEVSVKKTDELAFTDSAGFFSIACDHKDKLYVDAQGFDRVKIKVKRFKDKKIDLTYSNEKDSFEKAVKNGHVRREILQKAIEKNPLKGEKDYSRYNSIYDLIDDEIFNVNVSGTSITTQRPSTFTGSQEVLLVVNGTVVSDVSFVNPINVKSITHLDGPAAAKYGVRGGNGVIEIELK